MFIKANKTKVKGKEYTNYLLVESVSTEKGPRHKVVCSLGNLKPAPAEHWYQLAKNIEQKLSGQLDIGIPNPIPEVDVEAVVDEIKARHEAPQLPCTTDSAPQFNVDQVTVENVREAGAIHVCHQMWLKLGIDRILKDLGFDETESATTEMMVINRLVEPGSERATREWIHQTALPDILGEENCRVGPKTLYAHLDKLHPLRSRFEQALVESERSIFQLEDRVYLYDLTSTYFEGQCSKNDQAQHGYSRDQRPDCKQVVVGLVLSAHSLPIAHEVFDGNRSDTTTLDEMLNILDSRAGGLRKGRTVVMDRGLSSRENLASICERGYHYIVAMRQQERDDYLAEIESDDDWQTMFKIRRGKFFDTVINELRIKRLPTAAVAPVKARRVEAAEKKFARTVRAAEKAQIDGKSDDICIDKSLSAVEAARELQVAKQEFDRTEQLVVCVSKGRAEKDKAIREKQETKFLSDVRNLESVVNSTGLGPEKVHERIGRIKERYSRVARYYDFLYDASSGRLTVSENVERKEVAKELDGSYIIRTDRDDLTDQEIWHTYMMLTRVESAFRDMKSPLMERPIFHQLEHRVQTHIFLCVIAYHLLACIEKTFRDCGYATSWETLRKVLRTHQVVTVVMPTLDGRVLKLRRGSTPEPQHQEIYDVLKIPHQPIEPRKTWSSIAG